MPELPGHGNRIWMEVFYGAVEISGSRCGVEGCDAEPVAAQPIRTSEETGVRWLCREHADELLHAVPDDLPTAVRLINPTCGFGGQGDAPCGGASTHVAIVGIKDHGLDLVSVCARHVEEFYAAGR
jgi:hypothetical protein